MKIQRFAKQEIALRQIETALSIYYQEGDLFSVITLAGAAEEILGQLLADRDGGSGHRGAISSLMQILRPGRRKEPGREEFSGQEDACFVHLDPRHEARFLLGRAIDDYCSLTGAPSAGMLRFQGEQPAKAR